MNDLKQKVMSEIQAHSEVFVQLSPVQYRIRCPICGDSQKNLRDAHCYIKCSFDPSEPILYNCFKCNSGGIVGRWFLEKLNIKSGVVDELDSRRYNRLPSLKRMDVKLDLGAPSPESAQVKYIEQRLGPGLSMIDYERFGIVWKMANMFQYVTNRRTKNSMPSNLDSISFLSDDRSMLLSRTFEAGDHQWRKVPMYPSENKSFYTIKSTVNVFSTDPITVNIAEGVFDILSVYKNFPGENPVFLATLGSDYISGLEHIIAKGVVGQNVTVRVYMDADQSEKYLRYQLKRYKWIFGKIYICMNCRNKDVGVPIERIKLVERLVV